MATQCPDNFDERHFRVERLTTDMPRDKGPVNHADSGYISSRSTQDGELSETTPIKLEEALVLNIRSRQLFSRSRKTKLRLFDREISQAVQNRFSDLTELFGPSLSSFLVKRRVKYSAISIKLRSWAKTKVVRDRGLSCNAMKLHRNQSRIFLINRT